MTPNANVNWMYSAHINKSTTQFDSSLAADDKLGADLAQPLLLLILSLLSLLSLFSSLCFEEC